MSVVFAVLGDMALFDARPMPDQARDAVGFLGLANVGVITLEHRRTGAKSGAADKIGCFKSDSEKPGGIGKPGGARRGRLGVTNMFVFISVVLDATVEGVPGWIEFQILKDVSRATGVTRPEGA